MMLVLAQGAQSDTQLKVWFVEASPNTSYPLRPAYRCLICRELFAHERRHREQHLSQAQRLRDEDLVPITLSMRSIMREADLGYGDIVKVDGIWCIPRPFALAIVGALSYKHLRWTFNRLWHDDDGFGDAVIAAHATGPGGVAVFIEQQYRSEDGS